MGNYDVNLFVPGITPNPLTGKPFVDQAEYDSYLKGEEYRDAASGRDSAYPSAYAGTYEDWEKNSPSKQTDQYKWISGSNMDYTAQDGSWMMSPPGPYQFGSTISKSSETPGQYSIRWYTPSQDTEGAFKGHSGTYDPLADYGLGSGALGVVPVATDANGNPTQFWAAVPGGGANVFKDLASAAASAKQYAAWYDETNKGSSTTFTKPTIPTQNEFLASKGLAPSTSAGGSTETGTRGKLADPLQGEEYYDTTKGFYTQATDAKKAYDQYGSQPPEAVQNWNKIEGEFASPWQSEQTWDKYSGTFSDPRYLDQYFDYQQKKAQANLEGRASAAGVGDSSAAMRATGNLGAEFSARKLAGMQDFAKTGMTLAGEADTAHGNRLSTGQTLASTADTATNARISAAAGVDQAELARRLGGQNASTAAENLTLQRETGALTSATNISNDIASLVYGGVTQAQAQQFATQLQAIALKASQGQLTATAAYQQATELANSLGIIGNVATQYMIAQKLGGGSSSGSSGGTVVGPVPSGA